MSITKNRKGEFEMKNLELVITKGEKGVVNAIEIFEVGGRHAIAEMKNLEITNWQDAQIFAASLDLLKACKETVKLIELIEKWKSAEQTDSYEIMDEIVGFADKIIWQEAIKKAEKKI